MKTKNKIMQEITKRKNKLTQMQEDISNLANTRKLSDNDIKSIDSICEKSMIIYSEMQILKWVLE